jgi:hypothetical protein
MADVAGNRETGGSVPTSLIQPTAEDFSFGKESIKFPRGQT